MSELPTQWSRALREPMTASELDAIWRRVQAARWRKLWAWRAGLPILAGCTLALLTWSIADAPRTEPAPLRADRVAPAAPALAAAARLTAAVEIASDAPARTLSLSDGSRIVLSSGSRVAPAADDREHFAIAVERGRVRFEVAPQRGRRFSVQAGAVRVDVVGTVFSVERAPDHVAVRVEHGRVRVTAAAFAERILGAGESLQYSTPASPARPSSATATSAALPPAASAATRAQPTTPNQAAVARPTEPAQPAARDAKALLELADRARAEGRAHDAARALTELLARDPRGKYAALAALTLGRLQLQTFADARAAIGSLRHALELGLPSALEEDARARLVQAAAAAGDRRVAAAAAEQYRSRFPQGRWRASVDGWAPQR